MKIWGKIGKSIAFLCVFFTLILNSEAAFANEVKIAEDAVFNGKFFTFSVGETQVPVPFTVDEINALELAASNVNYSTLQAAGVGADIFWGTLGALAAIGLIYLLLYDVGWYY